MDGCIKNIWFAELSFEIEETVVSQYYIQFFVLYSTFIPLTPEICSREQQAAVSSESNPPSLPLN